MTSLDQRTERKRVPTLKIDLLSKPDSVVGRSVVKVNVGHIMIKTGLAKSDPNRTY